MTSPTITDTLEALNDVAYDARQVAEAAGVVFAAFDHNWAPGAPAEYDAVYDWAERTMVAADAAAELATDEADSYADWVNTGAYRYDG